MNDARITKTKPFVKSHFWHFSIKKRIDLPFSLEKNSKSIPLTFTKKIFSTFFHFF